MASTLLFLDVSHDDPCDSQISFHPEEGLSQPEFLEPESLIRVTTSLDAWSRHLV